MCPPFYFQRMEKKEILKALGIESLTSMQETAASEIGKDNNVVLLSPTGSGKTLAFLLPLVQKIDLHSEEVQVIVVLPTRELVIQSSDVLKSMKTGIRALSLYGGRPTMEEHRQLRAVCPQLVFATPGRLLDHLGKENFRSATVRRLVIDEFDKCMELGFEDDMKQIFSHLRGLRQVVFASATDCAQMPAFISDIGFKRENFQRVDYLNRQANVQDRFTFYAVRSKEKDKLETLQQLLLSLRGESAVVFVSYRESVERVGAFLKEKGFCVQSYHGGMEQERRERNLYQFRAGAANVLVSTDLAARGLDIPEVQHVIHYHLPTKSEDFTHRIGRTARWDREGCVYLLLGPTEDIPEYITRESVKIYDLATSEGQRPTPSPWVTIYIGRGKKEKLSKIDVVGFFCKQGGLTSKDIGRIDVMPHQTYVALRRSKAKEALRHITGEKIKGMKTLVEMMRH